MNSARRILRKQRALANLQKCHSNVLFLTALSLQTDMD